MMLNKFQKSSTSILGGLSVEHLIKIYYSAERRVRKNAIHVAYKRI